MNGIHWPWYIIKPYDKESKVRLEVSFETNIVRDKIKLMWIGIPQGTINSAMSFFHGIFKDNNGLKILKNNILI